jgi:hypothetical protein
MSKDQLSKVLAFIATHIVLLYRGFHTYWILLPLIHIAFVFVSIPAYVLVLTVLIWLGSKYVLPTN